MEEPRWYVVAMLDGDHSKWSRFTVRGKTEESARKKAAKNLNKKTTTWEIDSITKITE